MPKNDGTLVITASLFEQPTVCNRLSAHSCGAQDYSRRVGNLVSGPSGLTGFSTVLKGTNTGGTFNLA